MMTASAVLLVNGKAMALDRLLRVAVTTSLTSPAQSLYIEAAVDAFPGELGEVTVSDGARDLFTGRIDRQVSSLDSRGRILTIEARSKGALLLDNEAVPCAMTNVNLTAVFSRFIAPYGFLLYNPSPVRGLALYTVGKGRSEWEALTGYTLRVYGRTPYVSGDQVMMDRPRSLAPIVIGGAGLAFTKLLHTREPYNMLSEVVLRDADGCYRSAVRNPSAAYRGVRRKRYVIPSSEFVDSSALDANQRIRRSMLNSESVTVTLPGIVRIAPGREVRIADESLTLYNLMADDVTWRQDADGITTTLKLISSIYFD